VAAARASRSGRTALPASARGVLAAVLAALVAGCGGASVGPASAEAEDAPRFFDYVAVDGSRLGSDTTRGRITVILVLTTYDISSQYAARELANLARSHRPRINAGALALEPPRNAPLVDTFAKALALPYPVALESSEEFRESGPFGRIEGVPTVIVLDPEGHEAWRREGAASAAELGRILSRIR
jgi:hypothetical protein